MTAAPGEADLTPGVRQLFGAVKQEFVRRTIVAGIWVAFFQSVPATIVRTGRSADDNDNGLWLARDGQVPVRRTAIAGIWAAFSPECQQ